MEAGSGRLNKSIWKQLEPTIEEHKRSARKHMKKALAEAEEVKANYQRKIRIKNREAEILAKPNKEKTA